MERLIQTEFVQFRRGYFYDMLETGAMEGLCPIASRAHSTGRGGSGRDGNLDPETKSGIEPRKVTLG